MITTFTGKWVNLLDFQPEDVNIEDIAHALACNNRFVGHLKEPVSVAQHSVYVSRLCRNTSSRLQALLHDASEAYIGDVTKWLKQTEIFDGYRELESHIQRTIYRRFGCLEEDTVETKTADMLMVRFEATRGFPPGCQHIRASDGEPHPSYGPLTKEELAAIGRWKPWDWKWAKLHFMSEFRTAVELDFDAQRRAKEFLSQRSREILLGGNDVAER